MRLGGAQVQHPRPQHPRMARYPVLANLMLSLCFSQSLQLQIPINPRWTQTRNGAADIFRRSVRVITMADRYYYYYYYYLGRPRRPAYNSITEVRDPLGSARLSSGQLAGPPAGPERTLVCLFCKTRLAPE